MLLAVPASLRSSIFLLSQHFMGIVIMHVTSSSDVFLFLILRKKNGTTNVSTVSFFSMFINAVHPLSASLVPAGVFSAV